ncbi:MAG: hypothetical protein KKH91_00745 [Elusimicrobia bacterium]|nr:hypothetical protein [Elusimicrobiota bacterium]
MLNKQDLEKALNLLGKRLELENTEPFEIVVCGGSALIITGLINRVFTKDVDLIGFISKTDNGEFIFDEYNKLPEIFEKTVKQVALDLGLSNDWLNTGPKDLVKQGLPQGLISRLQPKQYGSKLIVHFISRIDQIYFKVYASVDSGPGRHVDDLLELKPTSAEIEGAAKWALTQDPSGNFKQILKDMLEKLGYGPVVKRI